jgi:hypothetical protein
LSTPVDEGKPLRGDGFFHQCTPTLARAMVEVAPQGRFAFNQSDFAQWDYT